MTYEAERHHRRSIRMQGYDYSQAGAYFVTVCALGRECLFGKIVNGEMRLNDSGRMVQDVWDNLPNCYAGVELDAFVVMPNHIHGIVVIVGAGPRACPHNGQPQGVAPTLSQPQGVAPTLSQPQGVAPTLSLPDAVHRFKTLTTNRYMDGVKQHGWPLFPGRVWQRNYYEHIIRNDESLLRIREYILNNPVQWGLDRENPTLVSAVPEPSSPKDDPWHI